MARVAWSEAALDQLDQIVAYIALFDPQAADRMSERLVALGNSLTDFPHRGRPSLNGTRELVTVPPYRLRYDVDEHDVVNILDIRHGARRPRED